MRALGYWLLYATVGAINGICLGVTAFGAYLLDDPEATKTWAWIMVGVCGPAAAVLSIWTLVRIVNDLNRRRRPA